MRTVEGNCEPMEERSYQFQPDIIV